MLQNKILQISVFVLAGLVLLGWIVFLGSDRPVTPEALADRALSEDEETVREEAALELSRHPEKPVELLRKVFSETSSDRVKAAAAAGLGNVGDWDSMPQLIEAMRSDNAHLRGRAYSAACRILNQSYGRFAMKSDEERREIIKKIEDEWPILHKGHEIKQRLLKEGKQPVSKKRSSDRQVGAETFR